VERPRSHRLDVADDTYVVAAPDEVAAAVHDRASWARWWPDLAPTVTRDRGVEGVQWSVGGALQGSMELWLEPWGDGVLVHWYLRADPSADRPQARRGLRRLGPEEERDRRARDWKRHVHALKDALERGREPGSPRRPAGPRERVKVDGQPADPT